MQKNHLSVHASHEWQQIFTINTEQPLWLQAKDLSILLDAIQDDHHLLQNLSEHSRWLLRQYFPLAASDVNIGEILHLVTNYPQYQNLQTALSHLIALSSASGIEGLSLRLALESSQHWHQRVSINLLQLKQLLSRTTEINGQLRLLPHAFLLDDKNVLSANIAAILGIMYAYSSDSSEKIHQILHYHRKLHEQRLINANLTEESHFLQMFDDVFNYIKHAEIVGNASKLITTQSLAQWLPTAAIGRYQLKAGNFVITLLITQPNSEYQYALFEPNSGEIKFTGLSKQQVAATVVDGINSYLTVELPEEFVINNKKTRADEIGFKQTASGQFKFDIYRLDVDSEIENKINRLSLLATNPVDAMPSLTAKVGSGHIQLATLQQAGAFINKKPVTLQSVILLANQPDKLTFDVQQLNDYLAFANGSTENNQLVKIIRQQLARRPTKNALLANEQDLALSALSLAQLSAIEHHIDTDNVLWQRIQQNSTKLPRYARIMNKVGYGTQAVGLLQLVNSTRTMLAEQQSAALSEQQRAEIDRNIIIAWSSAAVNFGTDIIQPLLLKAAYKATGSYRVAGTFAGRAVMLLNAAAAGFDLYYAYDSFRQLASERDPDLRQDLIVNGVFSLIGAGAGLATALAIFAGSSVAGPVGILFGAGLMLGGMTYNGVRTVARIKQQVVLTAGEEFETGLRVALGLQLPYSVQNKLQKYQVAASFNDALFKKEREKFEDLLKPIGYNLHFYINETQQAEELPYFHLQDKQTNQYIVYHDMKVLNISKSLSLFFTSPITLWATDNINYGIEKNKRRFTESELKLILQQFPNKYNIESVKIKEYIPSTYEATDEIILLTQDHDNILTNFANIITNQNKIFTSNSEKSKVLYFTSLNNKYDHNFDLIENYLATTYFKENISAVSFNTGNGNDVILGLDTVPNRFEVYNGKKVFIGGNKDDIFILNNRELKIDERKNFYGKNGNDSIIVNSLPIQEELGIIEGDPSIYNKHSNTSFWGCYIDLKSGVVKYLNRPFTYFEYDRKELTYFIYKNMSAPVALINSFENANGINKGHNIIIGNENANILSGGNGRAILHGEEGNDVLSLTQGYANGGKGIDRYIIERYSWAEHIKILPDYRFYNQWDPRQQIFINPNEKSERFRFNRLYGYNCGIEIDEAADNSKSIIELAYGMDEITSFERLEKDILLNITLPASTELNETASSLITVKLKNAYDYHGNGKRFLTHQYHLRTEDGFILTPYIPQWTEPLVNDAILYEAMYVRNIERHAPQIRPYFVAIDLAENSIETYKSIYRLPNNIRPMKTALGATETIFSGDRDDNHFYNIKSDSYFHMTKGVDHYYINDMSITNLVAIYITFDYAKIANHYKENDSIVIYITEYSGYDFFFDTNELVHKDKKNDIARIKFINWQQLESINILIQDKNQQKFNMVLSEQGNFIAPLEPVQAATEQDDIIVLPLDYRMNDKLLDAGDGNDIVTDVSKRGHIIKGGKGNDIITVKAGNNILLDGEGDDALYGGDDDDILISSGGNVTLAAGKGNNIIFINQLNGHVKIINNGGKDTIILQDKKIADYQIVDQNSHRSYLSSDGLSSIVIEDYNQQHIVINAAIGQGETLTNKQLDSLIDFIAAFDPNRENGSIDLITYLPTFNIDLDFSVATTI